MDRLQATSKPTQGTQPHKISLKGKWRAKMQKQDPLSDAIEEVKARAKETRQHSCESQIAARIIVFSALGMVLLTAVGAWVKWFWVGWVFAGYEWSESNVPAVFLALVGGVVVGLLVSEFSRRVK